MDPATLETRLRLGEDTTTEFKGVAGNHFRVDPHDLARTIAAMANTRGGLVLLGVEDDGTPTGAGDLQQADALMRQVSQACHDLVHPPISCALTKVELRGVTLLIVEVPPFSADRPYRAARIYYHRDANRCREATREEMIRLLESAGVHFDEQPVEGTTAADLDDAAVREFLALVYGGDAATRDVPRYLRALSCLDETGVPTVAGILFFGREPQRRLRDARISAVRLPGTTITSSFEDRREIQGRLPQQIEAVMGFLARHLRTPSHLEGWERKERAAPAAIPDPVLREAVVNALTHRDYRMASQIRLLVFDDRVEVVNPGGLLNRLTLDSIRIGGISQRRNHVIASLITRASRRENLGIGIPEMIRILREAGLPEPEFDVQAGHFRVVLRASPAAPAP